MAMWKLVDAQDVHGRYRGPLLAISLATAVGLAAPANAEEPWWGQATTLGAATSADLTVVTDAAGNDTLAWFRDRKQGTVRYAEPVVVQRIFDGTWSLPQTMGRAATRPDITLASTPDGHVTAVWVDETLDDSGKPLEALLDTAVFDGTSWSEVSTIWRGRAARDPRLDVSPTGTAVVTWTRVSGTRVNAMGAVRTPDGAWQSVRRIDDSTAPVVTAHRVGVTDDGEAVVTYLDVEGTHAVRWTGAAWTSSTRLTRTRPRELAFRVTGDGRAAIAYVAAKDQPVRSRFMGADGRWGAVAVVDRRPAPVNDRAVSLAACPRGGWGFAWSTGLHQVRLREYDGSAWRPDRVIHQALGTPRETHLIYHGNGDAMLVWNEDLPTPFASQIRALTRSSWVWSSDPSPVSSNETDLTNLRVVDNDSGHVVVAWTRVNTGPDQVQAALAEWPDGTVLP